VQFIVSTSFSDPSHLLSMARTADESGWDWVAISDHVIHPAELDSQYPYSADGSAYWDANNPWPDAWVTIGAMAAVTSHVRFLTNVFVLPARHPLLVAKAVGTAAVLSNNRVALGIGVGWMREEFDVLGQSFATRGKRADEAIDILRSLWAGGMVEHHGRHYDFPRLQMSPAPTAPVPILVGGISEPALRRAARADGWISVIHSVEEIRDFVRRLMALRTEAGRTGERFEVFVSCSEAIGLDDFRRLADAGATGVTLMPWLLYGKDGKSLAAKQESITRFADEVIRHFR